MTTLKVTRLSLTTNKVFIKKHNEVYIRIKTNEDGIYLELKDHFTFKAHNYKFHPLYRARKWNGDISLFTWKNKLLYAGLLPRVKEFCKKRGYECIIEDGLEDKDELSVVEAREFAKRILSTSTLPLEIRDYQLDSFIHCVRNRRALFLSPTASGKSLIIYWLTRYYNRKTLIIVDSINLLHQLSTNFRQYGFDNVDSAIHLIYSGSAKTSKAPITITTWQSATKMPKEWFDKFEVVIGDEAHRYKAKSLKHIMESLEHCQYRFGFTGSLDGMEVNELTLEGLFGPREQIVTTKDLIDQGHIADVEIKALILKYSDKDKKEIYKQDYQKEIEFLYSNEKRNRFIENLALSLKGNTILLFQRIESHGVPLYDNLCKKAPNVPIYYVAGDVDGEEREKIRNIVNTHETSITVASVGTFSVGVDIPNINNVIVAAPTKSVIRVLQTIGRGLRKTATKKRCIMFDIADDLRWKKQQNYTIKHFQERMKIYIKEQFKYKIYNINLDSKQENTNE